MSIPQEELLQRWTKLQEAMVSADWGGLLVFANQLKTANLHYVANYTLLGSRACCYLPPAGSPVLLISEPWDLNRAQEESPIKDVRVLGRDWPQELAVLCGSRNAPIGLAGREVMGRQDLQILEAALGRETVSASRLMEDLADIKSPYEQALIRASSEMADAGFLRAMEVMRSGLPDYELVAEIDYAMRRMGATDNFQMLAVGKQNTGMLLPVGKKVERGDLILFEITPANGSETYSAQLCRTVIFGESPDALLQEKYGMLRQALEESLSVIRPGVMIGEVARIQNKIIEAAGYGEYCQPPFMRARGHGFGLGRIEIDEDSPLKFAAGMSLVVHPNQYLPETGYLALGEHIIVTENGIERLTKTESRIYECPDVG
jgi:Xaa-Pro aminopeptidase